MRVLARIRFGHGVSWAWLFASGLVSPAVAFARPEAPAVVCSTYADAADCLGRVAQCQLCHDSTYPPVWNSYGQSLIKVLPRDVPFEEGLAKALHMVESLDADEDGNTNLEELMGGTYPADPHSKWVAPEEPTGPQNPQFDVGVYDLAFAFRRASILYCGRSPSFDELMPFRAADADPDALREQLHARVGECLDGEYWRSEGLKRLGDNRIRPAKNAGQDSNVSLGGLRLVIGDYEYDYRLWVYVLTADRDARDLLLAQYYVVENSDGSWRLEENAIPKPDPRAIAGGQVLPKERRVGMLTTQWFLARNTMFSELPRTSAAAAYRAYLGADIAMTQGLIPVAGEPDDVDKKGVKEARCASCHSTLDPLAYAFVKYDGISTGRRPPPSASSGAAGDQAGYTPVNQGFGAYDDARGPRVIPGWDDTEQQPVIFGEPVQSLREWAEVAANSDAFARNLAQIFFEHALSRGPSPGELEEFTELWQKLPEDKFSANRLIHRLIDSRAFGVP